MQRGALLRVDGARLLASAGPDLELAVNGVYAGADLKEETTALDLDGNGDVYLREVPAERAACLLFQQPRVFFSRLRVRATHRQRLVFRGASDQVLATLAIDYHAPTGWQLQLVTGEE